MPISISLGITGSHHISNHVNNMSSIYCSIFMYITKSDFSLIQPREKLLIKPFYRWGNCGSKKPGIPKWHTQRAASHGLTYTSSNSKSRYHVSSISCITGEQSSATPSCLWSSVHDVCVCALWTVSQAGTQSLKWSHSKKQNTVTCSSSCHNSLGPQSSAHQSSFAYLPRTCHIYS